MPGKRGRGPGTVPTVGTAYMKTKKRTRYMKCNEMNYRLRSAVCAGVLLGFVLLSASCGGPSRPKAAERADTVRTYAIPRPPAMMSAPEDRAAYVAEKYWNAFDFRDTTWLADTAALEQTFVNYLGAVKYAPRDAAESSLRAMLRRAESEGRMYRRLAELAERYLYEPNSPVRDYDLYGSVVDALLGSPVLDTLETIRPAHQREVLGRNRVGSVASEIRYETPSGRRGSLSGLRTPYVLLFFHDPDCGMCRELTLRLDASPLLRRMIEEGRLTVLTIYPDKDEQAWRAHAAEMPQRGWVHGWDRSQAIKGGNLYDVRARPTLYLLSGGRRVELKDVYSVDALEAWFSEHAGDK